jgi:3-methyladenine DNA glycosylase AlkD
VKAKLALDARAALAALRALATPERARASAWYFKTGPGEYGEGDRFLGVTVPATRGVLRGRTMTLREACTLLESEWHEARLLALLALVELYQKGTASERKAVFRAYMARRKRIDNWDLVDSSAPQIVGAELCGKRRAELVRWTRSKRLWERRIAMLATLHTIRQGDPTDGLAIAELLLHDEHDLIHKAVGWMLREIGERCSLGHLRAFLNAHAGTMPRTALRYAIEKLDPAERKRWMTMAAKTPR